jgi:hypothetical protein
MISQKLVELIETHAEELTKRWLKEVRVHPGTRTYWTFSEEQLRKRAFDVYSRLGRWVGREEHADEVEASYAALGADRYHEGFRLSEVITALMLTKKQLWAFVLGHGFFDSVVQLYQALELYNSVVSYFDRAAIHTVRGYEEAAQEGLRRAS